MKQFNWEDFKTRSDLAVYCSTEEQAIDFCKEMHKRGFEWSGGW